MLNATFIVCVVERIQTSDYQERPSIGPVVV